VKFSASFFLIASSALVVAAPVMAQNQRTDLAPIPNYEVHRTATPPRIDGKLDDAIWQASKPVTFVFPWPNQTSAKQNTTARLTWDNENLYVAYECDDRDITAVRTQRDDPTYMDDAVEIFIGPPGVKNLYLGFEMNARAALYDYLYPFPQRFIKNYNLPGVRISVALNGTLNNSTDQDEGWSLEVAIPWSSFADLTNTPVPKIGDRWIVNLNRWDGTQPNRRLSQWSDSGMVRPDPHYPDRFGQLIFME
jgi:hypothetical protein